MLLYFNTFTNLHPGILHNLQGAVADRGVLQVDQAEPEDQDVPGNEQERGDDAGVGGDDLLRVVGLHQVSNAVQIQLILPTPVDSRDVDGASLPD